MTRKEQLTNLLENVKEDLREQLEDLPLSKKIGLINEINCYDGSFDNLIVYENDEEFFQTFFSNKILEAVRAICYGNYKYTDEFVRFNSYDNLESFNSFEFEEDFNNEVDDIIYWILENYENIDIEYYIDAELLYKYFKGDF